MKTLSKIVVMALALFTSNGLFAQGRSVGRGNAHVNRQVKPAGIKTREDARVNGSLNANAHANDIAKSKANSNSVLNGNETIAIAHEKKHHRRHNRKA
jgi:hypothetical protein